MSGRRAMPHPGTPRLVTARPGRVGQYRPRVQAMESPRILTRGTDPARRPGRVTDGAAGDGVDGGDTEDVTGALDGGTFSGSPVGRPRSVFDPARASAAAAATAAARTRFCAGLTTGDFPAREVVIRGPVGFSCRRRGLVGSRVVRRVGAWLQRLGWRPSRPASGTEPHGLTRNPACGRPARGAEHHSPPSAVPKPRKRRAALAGDNAEITWPAGAAP